MSFDVYNRLPIFSLMNFEVICGRVADASPVIGAAMWWHGWEREDYDKLAYALVAGHLIVSILTVSSSSQC